MNNSAHSNSLPSLKKPSGFTLIELLIVVSLITLMSAASIPGFRGYIIKQNVKQSMEQVKSDLRTVQIRAMSGSLSDVPDVAYWGVVFTQGGNSYTYAPYNSSFTAVTGASITTVASENLVGDAVIRQNRVIYFQIPTGDAYTSSGVICDPTGGNCGVIVGGPTTTGNNCARILVNSAGALFKQEGIACP